LPEAAAPAISAQFRAAVDIIEAVRTGRKCS